MADRTARGATTGGRRGHRRDLRLRPFPALVLDTPEDRRQAMLTLREWAEQETETAIEWFFRDKRAKRLQCKAIRALTVVLAVAGAALPLATAAAGGGVQGWGYVLLAVAAGGKGYDYFFGLSTGWMRDITAAQALQRALSEFRLAWTRQALATAAAGDELAEATVAARLELITGLVTAVRDQVEHETATWRAEFESSTQQLQNAAGAPLPTAAGER
ncbi:SLATT domain-containing protein [Streptomyces aidingensis]|uniref:SMODS and SLOG-associating 2TM effector domain-containing protein n=1 Tax=Streptomyces aidingensis TaxID=910347 RepID=A0A1I1SG98_9ACTN|nr:SLATT domain-containing protein [Streptomyces aidingensis]SFD45476.1 hypothetical protein SAMN05421773_11617 [Streptomyces aidingensis]